MQGHATKSEAEPQAAAERQPEALETPEVGRELTAPLPRLLLRLQRQQGNRYVQRLLAGEAAEAPVGPAGGPLGTGVARAIERARGGGRPLDSATREGMESAFGADFGGVRIHTGAEAEGLNREVSARAFTTGSEVFFGAGEYRPGSSGGRELLAHELAHVVQQGGSGAAGPLTVDPVGDPAERAAEEMAREAVRAEGPGPAAPRGGGEPAPASAATVSRATAVAEPAASTPESGILAGTMSPGGPEPAEGAAERSPVLGATAAELAQAVVEIEGQLDEPQPEPPIAPGGPGVSVQVPIDDDLLQWAAIDEELARRFIRAILGSELVPGWETVLYRKSGWRSLTSREKVRRQVTAARAAGRDTIGYQSDLGSLLSIRRLYHRLRREGQARFEEDLRKLHEIHYAEDAVLGFYIAHANGLISFVNGILDLPVAPINLKRAFTGEPGVRFLGRIPKLDYPKDSYGEKHKEDMEAGVMAGLLLFSGVAGEGLAGTFLGRWAAAGTGWLRGLLSGLTVRGVRVGPAILTGVRAWLLGSEISGVGQGVVDVVQAVQELRSGVHRLPDGTYRPATADDVATTLMNLVNTILSTKGGVEGLAGRAKAAREAKAAPEPAAPLVRLEPPAPMPELVEPPHGASFTRTEVRERPLPRVDSRAEFERAMAEAGILAQPGPRLAEPEPLKPAPLEPEPPAASPATPATPATPTAAETAPPPATPATPAAPEPAPAAPSAPAVAKPKSVEALLTGTEFADPELKAHYAEYRKDNPAPAEPREWVKLTRGRARERVQELLGRDYDFSSEGPRLPPKLLSLEEIGRPAGYTDEQLAEDLALLRRNPKLFERAEELRREGITGRQVPEPDLNRLKGNIGEILAEGIEGEALARVQQSYPEARLYDDVRLWFRREDGTRTRGRFTDNIIATKTPGGLQVHEVFEVKSGPEGGQQAQSQHFEWNEGKLEPGMILRVGGEHYSYGTPDPVLAEGLTVAGPVVGLLRARRHNIAPKGAEHSRPDTGDRIAPAVETHALRRTAEEILYLTRLILDSLPQHPVPVPAPTPVPAGVTP